jgi:hypothetical protein
LASLVRAGQPDLFAAAGGQANAWADVDGDNDLDYFRRIPRPSQSLLPQRQKHVRDVAPRSASAQSGNEGGGLGRLRGPTAIPISMVGFADPKLPRRCNRNDAKGTRVR